MLTFVPDKSCQEEQERAFRERMDQRKAAMGPAELNAIAQEAAELDKLQSAPNSPEALATLPRLSLSDVPPEPYCLEVSREDVGGATPSAHRHVQQRPLLPHAGL